MDLGERVYVDGVIELRDTRNILLSAPSLLREKK